MCVGGGGCGGGGVWWGGWERSAMGSMFAINLPLPLGYLPPGFTVGKATCRVSVTASCWQYSILISFGVLAVAHASS